MTKKKDSDAAGANTMGVGVAPDHDATQSNPAAEDGETTRAMSGVADAENSQLVARKVIRPDGYLRSGVVHEFGAIVHVPKYASDNPAFLGDPDGE